jgi:hypothetical protein
VKIEAAFFRAKFFTALSPFLKSVVRTSFSFSRPLKIIFRTLSKISGLQKRARKNIAHCETKFPIEHWQKNSGSTKANGRGAATCPLGHFYIHG